MKSQGRQQLKHLKSRYRESQLLLIEQHTIFQMVTVKIVVIIVNTLSLTVTNISIRIINALVADIYVRTEHQISVGTADRL